MNEPRDEHDDLRQLFHDAAADIRPQGSLDDIQMRTKKVDPMTRRWFLPVIAAAAVIGLAIGGAVYLSRDSDRSPGTVPPAGTPSVDPTTAAPGRTHEVRVYYLGDTPNGPRLFSEVTTIESDDDPEVIASEAGNAAIDGRPGDPDYRSEWTSDTRVLGLGADGGRIVVTLADSAPEDRPAGMSATTARLSVEQLVRSIQSGFGTALPIEFMATPAGEGEPFTRINRLLGVDTSEPVTAAPDDEVMAPVQISSPTNGQTVSAGDLKVTGVAAAFEANVVWELRVGGDTVVKNGHATAAECCTLAPYEFTLQDLEPGTYTLVVHDEDMSGEGRPVNQDTKDFTVE